MLQHPIPPSLESTTSKSKHLNLATELIYEVLRPPLDFQTLIRVIPPTFHRLRICPSKVNHLPRYIPNPNICHRCYHRRWTMLLRSTDTQSNQLRCDVPPKELHHRCKCGVRSGDLPSTRANHVVQPTIQRVKFRLSSVYSNRIPDPWISKELPSVHHKRTHVSVVQNLCHLLWKSGERKVRRSSVRSSFDLRSGSSCVLEESIPHQPSCGVYIQQLSVRQLLAHLEQGNVVHHRRIPALPRHSMRINEGLKCDGIWNHPMLVTDHILQQIKDLRMNLTKMFDEIPILFGGVFLKVVPHSLRIYIPSPQELVTIRRASHIGDHPKDGLLRHHHLAPIRSCQQIWHPFGQSLSIKCLVHFLLKSLRESLHTS